MKGLLAALALVACTSKWDLIIYEDKADLANESKWHRSSGYESLEACRARALEEIAANSQAFPNADYECGRDCKPMRPGGTVMVCQDNSR